MSISTLPSFIYNGALVYTAQLCYLIKYTLLYKFYYAHCYLLKQVCSCSMHDDR